MLSVELQRAGQAFAEATQSGMKSTVGVADNTLMQSAVSMFEGALGMMKAFAAGAKPGLPSTAVANSRPQVWLRLYNSGFSVVPILALRQNLVTVAGSGVRIQLQRAACERAKRWRRKQPGRPADVCREGYTCRVGSSRATANAAMPTFDWSRSATADFQGICMMQLFYIIACGQQVLQNRQHRTSSPLDLPLAGRCAGASGKEAQERCWSCSSTPLPRSGERRSGMCQGCGACRCANLWGATAGERHCPTLVGTSPARRWHPGEGWSFRYTYRTL